MKFEEKFGLTFNKTLKTQGSNNLFLYIIWCIFELKHVKILEYTTIQDFEGQNRLQITK